jgi:mannitol-1-phosphate/altronate dehydrogenase
VSAEDAARLNAASGLDDRIPLVAEDFTQWVIEDRFTDGRPALEKVGAQLSDEVKLWEQVKVRVLNAGHLTLAYPAVLLGYHEVAEAMRDAQVPVYFTTTLQEMLAQGVAFRQVIWPQGRHEFWPHLV